MLFFTDIFNYCINLLHTSSCQCGILTASMQSGCSPVTPALLKCNRAAALLQLPSLCCSVRVWPHSKPTAAIPIPSPTSPCPSHYRERWLFMQSPFHHPMHWPVVLHREPRKHQSKSAVWHWLHDPTSPTPTNPWGHRASYRCPSPGESSRQAVFVSHAGEGKPLSQRVAKNNSQERRNSLTEKAREAKCVCARAEPAASHPVTHSHKGSGLELCPPGHPHTSCLLSWAVPVGHVWGPSCPLSVGPGWSSRGASPNLMLSRSLAVSLLLPLGHLGSSSPWGEQVVF